MEPSHHLTFGPFCLDVTHGRLWRGEQPIALRPLGALGRLSSEPDGAPLIAALRRYAPMWLAQLPGMVSDTELERLQRQVHGATPACMLRELGYALAVLAADTPLVLVLEDLRR